MGQKVPDCYTIETVTRINRTQVTTDGRIKGQNIQISQVHCQYSRGGFRDGSHTEKRILLSGMRGINR